MILDLLRLVSRVLLAAAIICNPQASRAVEDGATLRIALVADPHVSVEEQYLNYNTNFEMVIREVNEAKVNIVLVAGDLTNYGRREEFESYNRMIKGFKAAVVSVAGNHDVGNKVMIGTETTLSDERLDAYRQHVGPLFESVSITAQYRVVGITSSLLASGLERDQHQWEFLKRELPSHEGEFVILLMHYPLYINDPNESDDYMNLAPQPRLRLLDLAQRAGVKLLLTGHQHLPMDQEFKGIRMIGGPASSFGLPEGIQPEGWILLTCSSDGTVKIQHQYLKGE